MPLRFSRPVMALIATGTAAISIGLSAMPASADQVRNQEWWLSSLHVTGAWTSSQGSGVTVAVLSDGVNASSADLAGSVTNGAVPTGFLAASGQYAGEQGTPIASLIAGHGHGPGGSAGIIGVAPKARILSIPVTLPPDDPQLAQSSAAAAIPAAIAAGIRYAVNNGASVVDLPIDPGQPGSGGAAGAQAAAGGSAAEQAAVSYALAHNVVLVAPAGDNAAAGNAPSYPAAYHGVIAVGAFDSTFQKTAWSSRQSYVTLTAAGAGVIAADNTGGYKAVNSTSAASAEVSGVVALIRSRYPSLTVGQIRQVLISTTRFRRTGGLANGSGHGAVSASQALAAAAALAAPSANRADSGALPHLTPAAPTPASADGIAAQMLRAVEISGALLAFLLLLIAAYWLTGRRGRSSQQAVTAEWAHRQAQSRYPHAASDADQMLELFAIPPTAPAPPVALAAPPARANLYGRPTARDGNSPGFGYGVFAPAASRLTSGPAGRPPSGFGAEEPAGGEADGGWRSYGPASRAVDRRTSVSGAPPWEPAAVPEGELPWTSDPGRHQRAEPAEGPVRGPVPSDAPTWQAPAHGSRVSGPRSVQPGPAGYAGSGFAGSGYAGSGYAGSEFAGSEFAGSEFAGSEFAGSEFAGSGFAEPRPTAYGIGDHPLQPGSGDAAGPSAFEGYGPTGSGAHGGFDSRPDAPSAPRVAQSGLPVRQPQASRPPSAAPLSPSGSLWEPVSRDPGAGEPVDYQDQPTDYRDLKYDSAGRPIYAWDPPAGREPRWTSSED